MNTTDRTQAEALVDLLLADGGTVSVQDGEEWTLHRSADRTAILAAMGTTGMDRLRWFRCGSHLPAGVFLLIYGNGDGELIADHSDNAVCNALWNHWDALVAA